MSLLGDTRLGARRGMPVRMLLPARPAGPWWQNLAYPIRNDLGLAAERFEPRAPDSPVEVSAFLRARERDTG